jgi:hypothetical protein
MKLKAGLAVWALAALLIAALPAGVGAAVPPPRGPLIGAFEAYASCDNAKPFKAARHCGYDRARYFRATFVFHSNVGRRVIKACFQAYGPPPVGGGHACAKLKPTTYKAYPFKIAGVRQGFAVKVTWFVKVPGGGRGFKQAASSFLRVRP